MGDRALSKLAVVLLIGTVFVFHATFAQKPTTGPIVPGDAIDNDGDGLIDEEFCYNGIDEDGDGLLNEDCAALDACPRHFSTNGREFISMFLDNQPDESARVPLQMFVGRTPDDATANSDLNYAISTPLLLTENSADLIPARTDLKDKVDGGQRGKMVDLPYQLRVTDIASIKKGIHIRTDQTATIHGFNIERYSGDSFLGIPANALGRDYFAATYVPSLLHTEVAVVGLYSNTTINVTLIRDLGEPDTPRLLVFYNGVSYENGQSFLVTVQPYQVIIITSEYDMSGMRMTGDKPFAFFCGNLRTWVRSEATEGFIQSRDHLVEQIPPVETWGKRFVTYSYPPHVMNDVVRVMASQPNTDVVVRISNSSGDSQIRFNLRRPGMYREFLLSKRARLSAVANLPVMMAHYTHSQRDETVPREEWTDPALIYVPSVDQYDNDYVFGTGKYVGTAGVSFKTYVMLSTKKGNENAITLDGRPLDDVQWQDVAVGTDDGGSETYVQGYVTVADGVHRLRSRTPFGAIEWAVADRESYAMSLGIRFTKDTCVKCLQYICGDKVDNDCDGRIDEERCDGTDSDGDGLIDEDCRCTGPRRQRLIPTTTTTSTTPEPTTRRRTTTTPEPEKQIKQVVVPPGLCSVGRSRGSCDSVNVVFVADLSSSRLGDANKQATFDAMANFLKDAINNWQPSSSAKFGILAITNGFPTFNQALTDQRSTLINAINRKFTLDIVPDTDSSDLALALRMARTDMFASADAGTRKVVVVLAFGTYSDRTVINQIRNESSMLLNNYGADVYLIGQASRRDEIARLLTSPNNFFPVRLGDSWSQLSAIDDQSAILPTILSSCGDGFQSLKICYGGAQALSCPAGRYVVILSANFGRVGHLGETSCGTGNPLNCEADDVACPYVDSYYPVAMACNGQTSCVLTVNSSLVSAPSAFFPLSCRMSATYLSVNYLCADTNGAGGLPACSFTPASRMLVVQRDMTISASSYASCLSCGNNNDQGDQSTSPTCASGARSQCNPTMATFDSSAVEAWCPSLRDVYQPWIQADLGAPYVVLGVLIQGRRRLTTQYTSEVNIQVSNDANGGFTRVATSASTRRQTFLTNSNSTDIAWISFDSNRTIARYVRIQVEKFADHPALHFEVIINNKVRGCEAFRASGNTLTGQRGDIGAQRNVRCNSGTRTQNGDSSYVTVCQDNGRWSAEVACQ